MRPGYALVEIMMFLDIDGQGPEPKAENKQENAGNADQ
jgi:hypothetical protein